MHAMYRILICYHTTNIPIKSSPCIGLSSLLMHLPYYVKQILSFTATLIDPVGFTVMVVDPSADLDPVTANFSWTTLDSVTFDGQNITYTVSVTYENDTVVAGQSTTHPNSSLEISDLPACANLTATLVAERNNESSNGTVEQFSTSEPSGESVSCTCIIVEEDSQLLSNPIGADPISVGVSSMMSDYPAGTNISLLCSWNTSVYYVAWYKNDEMIYREDLAAPSVLMAPPQGITVDSVFATMMSNLTISSAVLDDSGNYTCAVTCGANGVELGMIARNLQDTTEAFVYGK